ncbi:MAG: MATE family efflux transporter [Spirochaetia bacterium]|jgi:putative MATE family efflux protein|nr:MATE family efflux transporter [Spirochaetia bacterium]
MNISKDIIKSFRTIAVPVALNNLLISSVSFIDMLMIGQLGATAISAVGIGNQVFFLFTLMMFGICSAASVFIAQFRGKKDPESVKKTVVVGLALSSASSLIFIFLSAVIPGKVMGLFTTDINVIEAGISYLVISAVSYLFSSVTFSYGMMLRSIEKAKVPLFASVVANFINIILNYLLIFGIWVFPEMGIKGAALATTIARFIESAILVITVYRNTREIAVSFNDVKKVTREFINKYIRIALPVVLNEVFWAAGMTMYKIVYGRIGTNALAAISINETILQLMMVLFMGSANACVVVIGKSIGEGDLKKTRRYARDFHIIGAAAGIITALLSLNVIFIIPRIFNVPDEVMKWTVNLILINAVIFPFKIFNIHNIVGIFRGGGDTKTAFYIEIISVWLIGVPVAFFTGLYLKLPVYLVFMFINIEEVFKALISVKRLVSGKWIHDLTK